MNPRAIGGGSIIIAVSLFVLADIYGSLARHDYSPVANAISELIETGAPNKRVLDLLIGTFHALVVPFAFGLLSATRNGRLSFLGPALLAVAGSLGVVLTLFFPCDAGCEPVTARGTAHIFIAVPMGFSVLLAILAFSNRFAKIPHWTRYARYSRVTAFAGLVLAISTVVMAETDMVGLLERVLTISYLQWYLVVGTVLLKLGVGRQ